MRHEMTHRRASRRYLLAAITCAVAAMTLAVPAAGAAPARAGTLPYNVTAACQWPPPAGQFSCMALIRTDVAARRGLLLGTVPAGYGPADLDNAYKLGGGGGQTVAIVDAYDDPTAAADLAVYRAQYGLPACGTGCFTKVNQTGQQSGYPRADTGWSAEISLDLDMVSAICPGCRILLVEATSATQSDLGTAVNEAVKLGAKFVSNSYGSGEFAGETAADTYYNHPGVAITVSTGDAGYGVSYPAASRYVTAVGGTSLLPAANGRGWDEIAWSGGGSGCSAWEAKPSWQHDAGCSGRTVADVSAIADPEQGGVSVYDSQIGGWRIFGGTSAASPIIASVYALAGAPKAGTYPAADPYANSGALFDIVAGTNLFGNCGFSYLCTAGPGYDGPTGLGTPDGTGGF